MSTFGQSRRTMVAVATGSRRASSRRWMSTTSSPRSATRSDRTERQPMRDGLVVVDKPGGWTSHDVVAKLRKAYGQRRVGHAGTLDPDATGVLLVGLGRATRLLRYLSEAGKAYRGRIVFGIATSTLDAAGEVVGEWDMRGVGLDEVRAAAAKSVGD